MPNELPTTPEDAAQRVAEQTAFSREFYLTVWAVAEVLFEGPDGPPPFERLRWLCDETIDFLEHVGARARFVLRTALFLLGVLGPIMTFRLPPFRFLSLKSRRHALERVERSVLSILVLALKVPLCLLYYEDPDAAREVGYVLRRVGAHAGSGLK